QMGTAAFQKGDLPEAEKFFREALERTQQFGPDFRAAITDHHLGEVLRASRRYQEAEPLLRQSIDILRKRAGSSNVDLAKCLNGLASVERELGHDAEAERLYGQSLTVVTTSRTPDREDEAEALFGLASLRIWRGECASAESPYRRALEIWETTA